MTSMPQRSSGFYFWLSIAICVGYFILFIFPNQAASENIKMVAVFEPDESVPLPYVFKMLRPADTIKQSLINFAFYEYYFYGFPHFAFSAISLIPLVREGLQGNIPSVMVVLRQVVSVLPMLIAILLLVHMKTRFRSYKSILLLLLLLCVPAVVRNNFWWHPDSLAILFAMLAIFFLHRDELRFGRDFYFAAMFCGFSAGTKGIGFYFFLSIFVYLLLGYFWKKASLQRLFFAGIAFIACMALAYLFANPTLMYGGVRRDYFNVMRQQSVLLSSGYKVIYDKGFLVALPLLKEYYGGVLFLLAALSACVLGIMQNRDRLFNIIALTWLIPISVLVLWVTHFKFQYWLPVALPLFSTVTNYLPGRLTLPKSLKDAMHHAPQVLISIAVAVQLGLFINYDIQLYMNRLDRAKDNASIQFYDLALQALEPLPDEAIFVYHDVRMYVPPTANWKTEAVFDTLDYDYIRSRDFDVILLMQQRIYDYLDPSVQGVDPEQFAQSQAFYQDADNESVSGYQFVLRNGFGLIFIKDDLYQQYFGQ